MSHVAIELKAIHVHHDVWSVEINVMNDKGEWGKHPHSPFHISVRPSYNKPESITGLVLQEVSCRLLHR